MKRCPECRRDYSDETLLYCLDDGTVLLDGPAAAADTATAIMPASRVSNEEPTQVFEREASLAGITRSGLKGKSVPVIAVLTATIFLVAGFSFYRYFYRPQPAPFR